MKIFLPIILLFSLVAPMKAANAASDWKQKLLQNCVGFCVELNYYKGSAKHGLEQCNQYSAQYERESCRRDLHDRTQNMCVGDCIN